MNEGDVAAGVIKGARDGKSQYYDDQVLRDTWIQKHSKALAWLDFYVYI